MPLKLTITVPGSQNIFIFHRQKNVAFPVIYYPSFFVNVFTCYVKNVHVYVK